MKHLYIKQNNNVEIVSSDIIEKLYQISQGEGLDSTSDLIGNLQCTHAYDDAVTYLTTKFKNLQINVTDGSYIRFADLEVQKICAANWGDGIGITAAQAASVSSVGTKFKDNTTITSFNELSKFSKITKLNNGEFGGCSNLQYINLSNITYVDTSYFWGSNIIDIKSIANLTTIKDNSFRECKKLQSVDISNKCTSIEMYAFYLDSSLCYIGDISNVTSIGDGAFRSTSIKYIKINNNTPATLGAYVFGDTTFNFYVPDESVDTYKNATNWSRYASRIKQMSTFTIDFPNG